MDTQVNILCLCQHFAVWYEAIKNDSPPDFGAPCESCRNQENCRQDGFPWMDLILPILDYQGIKINLVHQALQSKEGTGHMNPNMDNRPHRHS